MRRLLCVILAASLFSGCDAGKRDRQIATALVEARLEACDEYVRWVLDNWPDLPREDTESIVTLEYLAATSRQVTRAAVLEAPAKDAVARASRRSGEPRDLLVELYASAEAMCGLGANPYGLNKLTVISELAELRKKTDGLRSRLRLLGDLSEETRKSAMAPIEEKAQNAQTDFSKRIADRIAAIEAKAREGRARREADERAAQASGVERRQLESASASAANEKIQVAREEERRVEIERLRAMKPAVEPWFSKHYGRLANFATMTDQVARQLTGTPPESYPKAACGGVLSAIDEARLAGIGRSGSAKVDDDVAKILAAADLMARACVASSRLVGAGTGAGTALESLKRTLRTMGFSV
ncbi:MAG: hypothetical protein IPJ17_01370 [Holophagales bacterium]|nr:MAG: hypothetical protein IPJ17_01370 [Holophagales bacterium]